MAPVISSDPRVDAYAKLLVERCLDVQPGMQVLIRTTPLARAPCPGAGARDRSPRRLSDHPVGFAMWPSNPAWATDAPEELLGELSEIDRFASDHMDARVTMDAPENRRGGSDIACRPLPARRSRPSTTSSVTTASEIPWVSCAFPTEALAQDAGLTLGQFEDVLYGACLIDWDKETERMTRFAERFDAADEVHITGTGTDLTLSLAGTQDVDDGHDNMPGGEFFYSPLEASANGMIAFSEFAAVWGGHEAGVRLGSGRAVVEASAERGKDFLIATLDTDDGARRSASSGIGCNPAITSYMQNTSLRREDRRLRPPRPRPRATRAGRHEQGSVHWDIVKDMRVPRQHRAERYDRPTERHLARLIGLATCAELPEGEEAPLLDGALRSRGLEPIWAVWDDVTVDWSRFDLVVVRSAWDYA